MATRKHAGAPVASRRRCVWAQSGPMIRYHDEEWGVPLHEDRLLFEFLVLEGAQAGLSWETVLRKRERYRRVFAGFDPEKVACFDSRKIRVLLADPRIIRNRSKLASAVSNARALLGVAREFGSFDAYIWRFTGGRTIRNHWRAAGEVPSHSPESDAMSKELKRHGFSFVGTTICYSFTQATGMVNDHLHDCFRWAELGSSRNSADR